MLPGLYTGAACARAGQSATYASRAQPSLTHIGTYRQRSGHGLQARSPHGNHRQVILHGPGQDGECTDKRHRQ